MEVNMVLVKEKIDDFLVKKNISQAEFARSLGMSRQTLSNMLSGQQRLTMNFFVGVLRNYPEINLKDLFDDTVMVIRHVSEPPAEFANTRLEKLEKALNEIENIIKKTQS